ncbi:MAG: CxxC-x17-CxxC domain-containing protein [Candidatus Heimdallarchaeaceae archaeon]
MSRENYVDNREMFDIVCDDCGKKAQVPFKPDGERPVYCQDCYRKHRQNNRRYNRY